MGTPRAWSAERNGEAISLIFGRISTREPHLTDLDVAQACISDLDEAELVVVNKDEWGRLSALFDAIRAALPLFN